MPKSELPLTPPPNSGDLGWIELRAGRLTMVFDPVTGWVRYVRLGSREIVRAIYGAVRDRDWGTVQAQLTNVRVTALCESFKVEFHAQCEQGDIAFGWNGNVIGTADGTVLYKFVGAAASEFLRNRIGLCVLHPLRECAGRPCEVEHVDGRVENTLFPRLVSPDQPFRNVRALRYSVAPEVLVEVRFTGETFETEDQRNWTDASFKTYSTPLERAFPVVVASGTVIEQAVQLTVSPNPAKTEIEAGVGTLEIQWETRTAMPPIGLGCPAHWSEPGSELLDLRRLRLSHLRVDVTCFTGGWRERLEVASCRAEALGISLHVAVHLSTQRLDEELEILKSLITSLNPPVSLWLVFQVGQKCTPPALVREVAPRLARLVPQAAVAAGSDTNFAELNRNRPPLDLGAFPCYPINPQVHAFDDASLVENLGGQADTVTTAWEFCGKPVVVSPITLRPRSNPDATSPGACARRSCPATPDPRQWKLFGAAWTLGSLAALACLGQRVHSMTYFEVLGQQGILESASKPPSRQSTGSPVVSPVYHVLAALAGFNECVPVLCSRPLESCALALLAPGRRRVLVANLRPAPGLWLLRSLGSSSCRVRVLSTDNLNQATDNPEFSCEPGLPEPVRSEGVCLNLPAYSIARIDFA